MHDYAPLHVKRLLKHRFCLVYIVSTSCFSLVNRLVVVYKSVSVQHSEAAAAGGLTATENPTNVEVPALPGLASFCWWSGDDYDDDV